MKMLHLKQMVLQLFFVLLIESRKALFFISERRKIMEWIELKTGEIINTDFVIAVDLASREHFYNDGEKGEKHEYYEV